MRPKIEQREKAKRGAIVLLTAWQSQGEQNFSGVLDLLAFFTHPLSYLAGRLASSASIYPGIEPSDRAP